jgi:hypothetical protein
MKAVPCVDAADHHHHGLEKQSVSLDTDWHSTRHSHVLCTIIINHGLRREI